jgi:glycosyltransferase involved in cell wall biosynthesis
MEYTPSIGSYLIVTPVKDEEELIDGTIRSVIAQTVRPSTWVIVDDGSRDRTPNIIQEYAAQHDWILQLTIDRDCRRRLGSAEIIAFGEGYELVRSRKHEFVVKLDGDIVLPPDYFSRILRCFSDNPRLGIASGLHLERYNGAWQQISLPKYHAVGAAKMIRTACLTAIGGFPTSPGWDTADEIKAWSKGWETAHFPEIQFYHLKPEGSASGTLRTSRLHGQIYHACGGGTLFLLLKVLQRSVFGKPFALAGISLLYGYLRAAVTRQAKLVTPQEQALYRRVLNERIFRRRGGRGFRSAEAGQLASKA